MREAYPVGGRKPITDSLWMQQVMQRGLPYIGRNADDLRDVFYDHELIVSLGCRSVLNIPLRWRGETLGTLNMLHEENWYDTGHVELARVFAQLALPAVMAQQTKESMA
jgi:transcriptional regulator with GAF, ATPase, and Fis domain